MSVIMDILGTLFGSESRVRVMRLFLFNPEDIFDVEMVSEKSKVSKDTARKEFAVLKKANLIRSRNFSKTVELKKKGKIIHHKVKTHGYYLNQDFSYITALKQLLIKTKTLEGGEIVKRLSKAGKLKLVIIAGVFTQDKDSRVDMFVVGNNISKPILNNVIKTIEAEIGKELSYVFFETPDYEYRLGMYDKLIRDVLDYPHQVLLDKISIQ